MTTAAASTAKRYPPAAQVETRRGIIRRIIGFLLASVMFSIVSEFIGMTFFWPELGGTHAMSMAEAEISFVSEKFLTSFVGSPPSQVITGVVAWVYYWTFEVTRIESVLSWLFGTIGLEQYFVALRGVLILFMTRLAILTLSLPLFALFFLTGLSTGLTQRDIRRWSGGREYGRVHHLAKKYAPRAFFFAWFIYLALPISLHPNLVILPCAIALGLNAQVLASTYKKYL